MILGTGTFGKQTDEKEAHRMLDKAAEAGINFIDTADVYPPGAEVGGAEIVAGLKRRLSDMERSTLARTTFPFGLSSRCGSGNLLLCLPHLGPLERTLQVAPLACKTFESFFVR
jgi:aldo/keto reductase family protein